MQVKSKFEIKKKKKNVKKIKNKKAQKYYVFRQVVLFGNFPLLTNKKIIKPRSNIFKIGSVLSNLPRFIIY